MQWSGMTQNNKKEAKKKRSEEKECSGTVWSVT
jgi:hypothetical protein